MEATEDDVAVQTKCCEILGAVPAMGFCEFVLESGGICLIVGAIKKHQNALNMMDKALSALDDLSFDSENAKRIADAGGIAAIIDTMKRHSEKAMVRWGIAVLRNLACANVDTETFIEADVLVEVVSAMKNHPQDVDIQEDGCGALASVAYCDQEGVSKKIADAGAISVVVKAMEMHPNQVVLQFCACLALKRFSKGGEDYMVAEMERAGVRSTLNAAIEAHSSHKYIVSCAKELWNLLVDSLL